MTIKRILRRSAAWLSALMLLASSLDARATLLEGIDFLPEEQEQTSEWEDSCPGAEIPPAPGETEGETDTAEETEGETEAETEAETETETETAEETEQGEKGVPVLADTNGDTEVHLFAPRDQSFPVGTAFRLLTVSDVAKEQGTDEGEESRSLEESLKSMWKEGTGNGAFFPYYLMVTDSAGQELSAPGKMEARFIFRDAEFYRAVCGGTCTFRAASQGKGNEFIELFPKEILRDDAGQTVTMVLETEKTGWICILRSDNAAVETEPESETQGGQTEPESETQEEQTEPESETQEEQTEPESETWEDQTEPESETWEEQTEPESETWESQTEPYSEMPEEQTGSEAGWLDPPGTPWENETTGVTGEVQEEDLQEEEWPDTEEILDYGIQTIAAGSSSGTPVTSPGSGFVKMDMANLDGSYRASRWYSGVSSFTTFNNAGSSVKLMDREGNKKIYYPLDDSAKGKFGVIYSKILYQNNIWYDMKITVADYTNQIYTGAKGELVDARPPIGFQTNDIIYYFKSNMGEVLLKVEYYRNGDASQTPQRVNTRFQWWDIDNKQRFGIRTVDGSIQAKYYQTSDCRVHWLNQTAEVDKKDYLVVTAWDSYDEATIPQGNVGFALSGCSTYYLLIGENDRIREDSESRATKSLVNKWINWLNSGDAGQIQLGILVQTDVETPVPLDSNYPQKAVSNDGATWSSANVLPGISSEYAYRIRQYVPWESSANYFSQFTITDALPAGVDYAGSLKVIRVEDNVDVTGNFTASANNDTLTVSAASGFLNNAGMYGYTFDITFKARLDVQEMTAQYQGNTASYHVSNGASVKVVFSGSGTVSTGDSNKVDTTASVARQTQQAPVKCLDANESLKEKDLSSLQDTIVFSVYQAVPTNAAAWLPTKMVFTDTLADCLEYRSAKVYQKQSGSYAEADGWSVSASGQTVKAEKAFRPSGETYRLDITCSVRDGYDMLPYRQTIGNRYWYVIPNTAEAELVWANGSPLSVKQKTNTASVRVNAGPVRVHLTLTKEIDTADIVWAHGNPTFLFCVSGEDLDGKKHTYYEAVEFTQDNVGGGEKAALAAEFEIPAGWYTASEEKTMRYRLNSIHSVTGGTVSGDKAVFDLSAGRDGFAAFYNSKNTDEGESHSAFVRNEIK